MALLLTAGIILLRLAGDNDSNAVLLLLVVPIGLVAAEFGWAGGMIAAAVSLGVFAVWNDVNRAGGAGPLGYLTRAVVFFGVAAAIGLLLDRPSSSFAEGPKHRLVKTPPRDAQSSPHELEGNPSRLDQPEAPGAGREHSAKVTGFSPGGRVLVRLGDGRTIEVPLRERMRNRFEVGSPALVYFDDSGILVGWYLPDAGIGVDMRDDR